MAAAGQSQRGARSVAEGARVSATVIETQSQRLHLQGAAVVKLSADRGARDPGGLANQTRVVNRRGRRAQAAVGGDVQRAPGQIVECAARGHGQIPANPRCRAAVVYGPGERHIVGANGQYPAAAYGNHTASVERSVRPIECAVNRKIARSENRAVKQHINVAVGADHTGVGAVERQVESTQI